MYKWWHFPTKEHLCGRKLDKLELDSFSEELQERDYDSLWSMIMTTIIKKKAKLLPYDMQHLLKLLYNPR